MKKEKAGRDFVQLTALCTVVYFVSYISRINLSASMVELVRQGFAPETTVALALSMCSISYGAGQIISGYLGDKCRPQNVIMCGFFITAAMNLGVGLLRDAGLLVAMWTVNGFAQSLMWPPLVAIMSRHFNTEQYSRACVWVSWGSSFGTIAVYAFTPLLISVLDYRYVFFVSGSAALVMALVWKLIYEKRFAHASVQGQAGRPAVSAGEGAASPRFGRQAVLMMGIVMLAILMQGALRDGVSNWMPTFISETFQLDSSLSILTGVLLPLFHIVCLPVASWLYRRMKNEMACAGAIFCVGVTASALLGLLLDGGVILSMVLVALLVGSMHGVNLMLTCMVPPHFGKYGRVSLASGVLNSATYVGSAISTYGIALFSHAFGWQATIFLWAGIAAMGALIGLGISRKWWKFTRG